MRCPFCREEIQDGSAKCRFCNEWLDDRIGRMQTDISELKDAEVKRRQEWRNFVYFGLPVLALGLFFALLIIEPTVQNLSNSTSNLSEPSPAPFPTISPIIDPEFINITQTVYLNKPTTLSPQVRSNNGYAVTYELASRPAHGTLGGTLGGNEPEWIYTPYRGFSGKDSFKFSVSDTNGDTGSATASLDVLSSDPEAIGRTYKIPDIAPLTVDARHGLLSGKSNNLLPAKASLAYPPEGKITIQPDGGFAFKPSPKFQYEDGFEYTVTDAKGNTSLPGYVHIYLDSPPQADDYTTNVGQREAVGVPLTAMDDNHDPLTFTITSGAAHGVLTDDPSYGCTVLSSPKAGTVGPNTVINAPEDGCQIIYAPNPGYYGSDSFSYKAGNGIADSKPAHVSITVFQCSAIAIPHEYAAKRNSKLYVPPETGLLHGVTGNDGPWTAYIDQGAKNGFAQEAEDGAFTYVPKPGFTGQDSFTYYLIDTGRGESDPARVVIEVK